MRLTHLSCQHDKRDLATPSLTPLRESVFKILASSHRALGAYQIIEAMSKLGKTPAPITVYRVLDYLMTQGLVHKIHSKNAFYACPHPHNNSEVIFLVCESCDCVQEVRADAALKTLSNVAYESSFKAKSKIIEIFGICAHCQ